MTKEELTALGLSEEQAGQVAALQGKELEAQRNTIATLTTERDGLKGQLETATGEIKSYKDLDIEGIKAKASEWEGKYSTETQALQEELEAAKYGYSVKEAVSGLNFSSASAKRAFLADLTEQKLPLQEGKLLGLDDFVKTYQSGDPGAFAPEAEDNTPFAVRGNTGGGSAMGADAALRAAMGLTEQKD